MDWYKDRGAKKHGWKNTYHKEEWGDNKKYHDVWRYLVLFQLNYFAFHWKLLNCDIRDKDWKRKWKSWKDYRNHHHGDKYHGNQGKQVFGKNLLILLSNADNFYSYFNLVSLKEKSRKPLRQIWKRFVLNENLIYKLKPRLWIAF